tara:strand:- start:969 stop:1355 length:387 start_codon:yes stop_codon:yes gene_type:complete
MPATQPEPDFGPEEYAARLEAAQRAMHAAGLDALWFANEPEVRYFSGSRTAFWQSPTRPSFLVVPRIGQPIAVIREIGAALMHKTGVEDIRTWPSPRPLDDGISLRSVHSGSPAKTRFSGSAFASSPA